MWVDRAGYRRLRDLVDPTALGRLKLEYKAANAVLHGPKDYTLDRDAKTKGIRRAAVQIAPGQYEQDAWRGLRGAMRAGDVSAPRTTRVVKHLRREYLKGTVLASGAVEPYRLSIDE